MVEPPSSRVFAGNTPLQVVIGLGANLGDRRQSLKSALAALRKCGQLADISALYESDAVGPPQPDYLNAAVLLESALPPHDLLRELLAIERAHGRERRERWGARTLDLDLLHSPGLVLEGPELTLPHPELARRAFALLPLLDVLPDAAEPSSGRPYRLLLTQLDQSVVHCVETRRTWGDDPSLVERAGRAE
jgi:2-amino-4-hydroxy-6-hydroxymethyldihydropteridine diphosphokinase